jgi:hypothetical protein
MWMVSSIAGRRPSPVSALDVEPPKGLPTKAAASKAGAETNAATRVTLGAIGVPDGPYARPRGLTGAALNRESTAPAAAVEQLMRGNSGPEARTLADHWRGLGGALLHQLAATGQAYRQTLAQLTAPVAEAASDDGTPPVPPVGGMTANATTLNLRIQTESGRTISMAIAVDTKADEGTQGLQVMVESSGELTDTERGALEALAEGLDSALEALGQGQAQLDLSGLLSSDTASAFTSLDLTFTDPKANPDATGAMQAVALHVDGSRKSLALKGAGGEMNVTVDSAGPAGTHPAAQRRAAIDRTLSQIDAAGEQGHADRRMLGAFKQGFSQLQASAVAPPASPRGALGERTAALQSGLADFEASFSADSRRTNRFGKPTELGHMDYRITQNTTSRRNGAVGGLTIAQVHSESISAVLRRTRTLQLDLEGGNYDETRIQDRKAVSTLIETRGDAIVRALRKTDEQGLLRSASLENHRVTVQRQTPSQRSEIERLL